MIKNFFVLISLISLLSASSVSFGSEKAQKKSYPLSDKKIKRYTIQLLSTKNKSYAKKTVDKLPKRLKNDTKIYKVGSYLAVRFYPENSDVKLSKFKKEFKKLGFKDAYITRTTKWHMESSLLYPINKKSKSKDTNAKDSKKQHISKYKKSNFIQKAQKAYANGDETTAMLYYEMLLNSGYKSQSVKNNLIYLYCKHGAWSEADELMKDDRYISKLLYSCAYGGVESNQDDFMKHFSQDIMIDKSGRLALLASKYYEQRDQLFRAMIYAKMAYKKNPSSVYNAVAYARLLDINKEYKKALDIYKKAYYHINKNDKKFSFVKARIIQLEELI